MRSEDVARYLQDHPEFFEQHADMMAGINIPHPHGGRAIPLSERQIISLREKNKILESKLRELVEFGEENDAIGEKVHRVALELMRASSLEALLKALYFNLREDFAVPHVTLRLWSEWDHAPMPEFGPASQEVKVFAESLAHPYCGGKAMFETGGWFGADEAVLKSFAYIPLRDGKAFGLIALASEDLQRFYPEMGTLYLKRLGELVSTAIVRYL
ncbi:MAG TPA: DUF484 family protein [Burkholderiales bacterium]|jgi:uncharacterized protein YigA (DUF484 family)|nr:DUF484 family protein [Burkholderiales bacterium]